MERFWMLLQGRFQKWNSQNIKALNQALYLLSKSNKEIFRMFQVLRDSGIKDRFRLLEVCGLYRQTRSDTIYLFFVILINKF
jgi:hypothetical protein